MLNGWVRGPIPPEGKLRAHSQWSLIQRQDIWSARATAAMNGCVGTRSLRDFIFHVEWRFTRVPERKGYNSGIYARNSADARIWHQAQTGDRSGGFIFGETPVNGRLKRF